MNRRFYLIMFAFQSFLASQAHKSGSSVSSFLLTSNSQRAIGSMVAPFAMAPLGKSTARGLSSRGGGSTEKLYNVSVCAVQGGRSYMEDEYFINQAGSFGAVFDGHGGPAVSRYLRQNLYANLQAVVPVRNNVTTEEHQQALEDSLVKVDREVQRISHWSFQGSTAVAAWILPGEKADEKTLLVANIGDSRAIMSHNASAVTLTEDHKPDTPKEKARIESKGGRVVWSGLVDTEGNPVPEQGVYRVNGNLALSRAVGDRSERPAVSAEPEFTVVSLDEHTEFVLLATDGLWDVMTSEEVVAFVRYKLDQQKQEDDPAHMRLLQQKMAEFLVAEALRRGTYDNVDPPPTP